MILYRCRTPTDRLCPCGRVARELRRRGIEVEVRRVRRGEREEIDALTGQDKVPLLVIGDEAICDSRRIIEHLRWREAAQGSDPARGQTP
ncbi:MAG TPA: glutathione S-transferase N-terminal domain-containing protein [Solirubrobacteraceae bacterium]|nr:glutathione S-transferase N-terminal domain-containing protein [Solirubrobacteraceae bacterium]